MQYALLTKISLGANDRKGNKTPMSFVNYHTGEIYTYHLRDTSLPCRVPVGGDCLADVVSPGWTASEG